MIVNSTPAYGARMLTGFLHYRPTNSVAYLLTDIDNYESAITKLEDLGYNVDVELCIVALISMTESLRKSTKHSADLTAWWAHSDVIVDSNE